MFATPASFLSPHRTPATSLPRNRRSPAPACSHPLAGEVLEELKNIALARIWVFKRPRKLPVHQILNEKWLRSLHLQMFSEIWEWAGKYRIIDTNIGIEFWRINQEIINAVEDARSQIGTKQLSEVERDLIVIRFSHRLVAIHPFPNGNGRWSRLMADALINSMGGASFTWGGAGDKENMSSTPDYIKALRQADYEFDFEPLVKFARS